MKIFKKYGLMALAGLALASAAALSSCSQDDPYSTDQYGPGVHLNVWGPCPVARGGELRFLGSGMDKVTGITLPGADKITDIKVVNNQEIRITVPQEAQEGYLTVHTAEGDIEAKTLLTFLEPIEVISVTPTTARPGETITIKGEYLNNIHELIFSLDKTEADCSIPEEDFVTYSRGEISFVVPATAKTGTLILSDGDPEMPNWIITDYEITVITPQVDNIITMEKARPGDKITLTGSDLDLAVKVVMSNGVEIPFDYADGKITFTLPDDVSEGPICLVTESGVEVVAVNIGDCKPEDLVIFPATNLRTGFNVSITGKNLQMVSGVSLPTASGLMSVSFNHETNEKITFTFPQEAQSGDAVLTLKGGGQVSVAYTTAKPEILTTTAVPAGATATLDGKYLDMLAAITFADGTKVNVKAISPTQVSVDVPATAVSGASVLHMVNGESSSWNANIAAPSGAYIISGGDEITNGRLVTFQIGNPEKLSGVVVNGENCNFMVNGSTLFLYLPTSFGSNTKITLVSSDGSQITYTYNFVNPDAGPTVIWEGSWTNSGWGGNQDLAWGGFDWSTVAPGTTLTLHVTPVDPSGWWCVSFRHGQNWGNLPGDVGAQIDTPEDGMASIVLTQEIIDDLVNNGGLVITGDGYTLTKVTLQ